MSKHHQHLVNFLYQARIISTRTWSTFTLEWIRVSI